MSSERSVAEDLYAVRYPTMKPFGKAFGQGAGPALLLVGESHYLPEGSTQHLDPTSWYGGDSTTLSETEVHWISTPRIIREARAEGFANRAHWIWKNGFEAINEAGPRYVDYRCRRG